MRIGVGITFMLLAGCVSEESLNECNGADAQHRIDVQIRNADRPVTSAELVAKPHPTAGGCGRYPGSQALLVIGDDRVGGIVGAWTYDELRLGFGTEVRRLGASFAHHQPSQVTIDMHLPSAELNGASLRIARTEVVPSGALRDFRFEALRQPMTSQLPTIPIAVNSTWNDGLSFGFNLETVFAAGEPTQKYVPSGANLSIRVVAPNGSVAFEGHTDAHFYGGQAGGVPLDRVGTWRIETTVTPDDPPRQSTRYRLTAGFAY